MPDTIGGSEEGSTRGARITPSGDADNPVCMEAVAVPDTRNALVPSLVVALTQALDEVTRRVGEITAAEGLSVEQWLVVRRLAEHGDQAMRDLVADTRLNDSTLTRVVDRLAAIGAIYREVDPTDRRRVRVTLSVRGRATHDRLWPAVEDVERRLLQGLDAAAVVTSLRQLGATDTENSSEKQIRPAIPRDSSRGAS
jgi:DNA-binding MarR family transcriptional regulator